MPLTREEYMKIFSTIEQEFNLKFEDFASFTLLLSENNDLAWEFLHNTINSIVVPFTINKSIQWQDKEDVISIAREIIVSKIIQNSLPDYVNSITKLIAYIFGVTNKVHLRYFNLTKITSSVLSTEEDIIDKIVVFDNLDTKLLIDGIYDLLSENEIKIFRLVLEGYSYRYIGDKFNKTEESIKQIMKRLRKKIRNFFKTKD